MGNCIPAIDSQSTSLDFLDLEELLAGWAQNYTYDDADLYNISLAQPCHPTYCLQFGRIVPPFLTTACILSVICNLILAVALACSPWFRDQPHPTKTNLFLLTASGIHFSISLPFFAVASDHSWLFGNSSCQVARGLKYGSLFAHSLLVAGTTGRLPWAFAREAVPLLLFVAGLVCAIPAVVSSRAGNVCVSSPEPEARPWLLAHTAFCVAGFVLLPVVMVLARVALKRRGKNWRLPMDITWLFYLFWAPYGVAQLLDTLLVEKVLVATCPLQEHLDYFLGISEGLGTLYCFLCPLIILGITFCLKKGATRPYTPQRHSTPILLSANYAMQTNTQ